MYLGNVPTELTKQDRYLLQILLAGSKKAITSKWQSEESPTIPEWIEIVQEIYIMERRTFFLRYATEKCKQYWKNWKSYLTLK